MNKHVTQEETETVGQLIVTDTDLDRRLKSLEYRELKRSTQDMIRLCNRVADLENIVNKLKRSQEPSPEANASSEWPHTIQEIVQYIRDIAWRDEWDTYLAQLAEQIVRERAKKKAPEVIESPPPLCLDRNGHELFEGDELRVHSVRGEPSLVAMRLTDAGMLQCQRMFEDGLGALTHWPPSSLVLWKRKGAK